MNGLKKAAVFLSSLDYTEADKLLSRLDVESARSIRREIMSLRHDNITVEETQRLDEEFLHTAGWQPAGRHREHQFATRRQTADGRQQQISPRSLHAYSSAAVCRPPSAVSPAVSPAVPSFDFMRHWSIGDIASAIVDEHPQTIAIVLAHLPQSLMKSVLSAFPPELQRDVQRRLDNYTMPDAEVVQEIESALRVRYRPPRRPVRQQAALEVFEDVATLNDSELAKLFRSVDLVTAMLALIGADSTLIARVTKHFSPTEEAEMRKRLKRLGNIDEEDIEQARQYILEQYNGLL